MTPAGNAGSGLTPYAESGFLGSPTSPSFGRSQETRRGITRMRGFGTTIFSEMTALANRTGAINLGQGFPDTDGPGSMLRAAVAAIQSGQNQYAPGSGTPDLRTAIARHQGDWYGLDFDPDTEVLVTAGATEAIAATLMGLCEPGDEVLCVEPYYDSYAAVIALAGAVRRPVTLRPPDYRLDTAALAASITPRTRVILINSPHNPTGAVFDRDELAEVARLCVEHDLIAVTDEVYEHIVFHGEHVPLATFPGMRDRTVTISSAGKTFSATGWKVGWICAAPDLVAAVARVKQFLTFTNAAPFQPAVAAALGLPREYFTSLATDLRAKRDLLCQGLVAAGFDVHIPAGTYFVTADAAPLGGEDGLAFCRALPERAGVVAVPVGVFYDQEAHDVVPGASLVRFAFCKQDEVLQEAVRRLEGLRDGGPVVEPAPRRIPGTVEQPGAWAR
ncbi:pyridoxal phosphate-dependent aminotransferase [Cryptosporangium minutisporangium]|uniref:Pyridoxal phosphate-dependent aminotransferase n=2 Tax=Cryptosporangium minutisporangium TaxID=113569 RepID=A0ABP6T0G9_9ACTN